MSTPAAHGRPKSRGRTLLVGIVAAVLALASLVIGSEFGQVAANGNPKLIDWLCAAGVLAFGFVGVERLSRYAGAVTSERFSPVAGSATRILSSALGYLFVFFAVLAVLEVSVERLLVGVGLAGVVLGIAAQQSLGNVFAGLVLLFARPFGVGNHIRVRSGALGGIFDATVKEMSLTYVTLQTADGLLKVPNSAMLAAGVGQLGIDAPPWSLPQPTPPTPAVPPSPGTLADRTTS